MAVQADQLFDFTVGVNDTDWSCACLCQKMHGLEKSRLCRIQMYEGDAFKAFVPIPVTDHGVRPQDDQITIIWKVTCIGPDTGNIQIAIRFCNLLIAP